MSKLYYSVFGKNATPPFMSNTAIYDYILHAIYELL